MANIKSGDIVQRGQGIYKVLEAPRVIHWCGRRSLRVPVTDDFGKTHVFLFDELILPKKRSKKCGSSDTLAAK